MNTTLEAKRRAARIVACVNACAGMVDPATEIASLRNALHLEHLEE